MSEIASEPGPQQWRPDKALTERTDALTSAISVELFDRVINATAVGPGGGIPVTVEDSYEAMHLYNPEVWPIVLVTADGQRFEVEIDVTVRALPDVATQAAEQAREVAELRKLQARQQGAPS